MNSTEIGEAVEVVLARFNFDDGVVNAGDGDARCMAFEIVVALAVCHRLVHGWHPSITHRQWFRSKNGWEQVRERMTDAEAEFIDRAYIWPRLANRDGYFDGNSGSVSESPN